MNDSTTLRGAWSLNFYRAEVAAGRQLQAVELRAGDAQVLGLAAR